MNWISVKEKLPPMSWDEREEYVLAFHSIHGVGVAWFCKLEGDIVEEMEEDLRDKYLCSFQFLKNRLDADYQVDSVDTYSSDADTDIFERSPHFPNLGTVTHWMELPTNPLRM